MTLAEGMQINLFASEDQFPELINPVQSSVDTDGRIWVAAWILSKGSSGTALYAQIIMSS